MGGAAASFAVLNATAKLLTLEVPVVQLLWARTAGHLLFVIAAFGPRYGRGLFRTHHPVFQPLRSLLLMASTIFNFLALRSISLATAATINFTSPFIVALLAAPLLGERVGLRRWAAIGAGFGGVLLVMQPGTDGGQPAALFALATAASYAFYQLLTRRVADADPPEITVGYSALVGTVLTTILLPFQWAPPRSASQVGLLVLLGLSGGVGHYCVARAYMWAPAAVVSPFNYLQLLGAVSSGYLVFGDVPSGSLWAGATLIIGSGLAIAYTERPR